MAKKWLWSTYLYQCWCLTQVCIPDILTVDEKYVIEFSKLTFHGHGRAFLDVGNVNSRLRQISSKSNTQMSSSLSFHSHSQHVLIGLSHLYFSESMCLKIGYRKTQIFFEVPTLFYLANKKIQEQENQKYNICKYLNFP